MAMATYDPTISIVPPRMLAGKVTIVTGASQGIGAVAAFGFASAGAKVALVARRGELINRHAELIREHAGAAIAIEADVADEDSVRRMVERTVNEFGKLDCAFNNAGVDQKPARPDDLSLAEWRRVFRVKADGTFLCLKYQCPAMCSTTGGGSIVNHGSVVGDRGVATLAAPCASQASVIGLTKAAAKAYGPRIRINMLATGAIKTEERAAVRDYPEEDYNFLPARRPGEPREVAAVAAWLLSDYASYQTGSIVAVDGGYWA